MQSSKLNIFSINGYQRHAESGDVVLGIACAFEQDVQRLSTSVSMVTKGMLKEHLLLLASSMTCAGFLVGFNLAGIKALNKTLNFQVPFSEATVYTPKRCFEKAAEKCHDDSLSSITWQTMEGHFEFSVTYG
ncbi:hypothetical protein L1987_12589 [Smallanthus sonchifolius]|uniref:Uncharacterized protein n=1 Tax=Smallanthus sonchifolius TaxID=185202 RepID=A0ACB9JHM8_9ASTR|nr:hypothetical protein L1987_12589 [Smallanthus sonchifolius]